MRKKMGILLLAACLGLAVGCSNGGDSAGGSDNGNSGTNGEKAIASENTLEKAQRQGFVSVGFANETPYAYATPDGQLTGEAVEVARAVLNNLGIEEMDGVLTEFGSLIPGLQAKRFDIITAGMFIDETRSKEVAFANPEYSIGAAIAVTKGNPHDLHSYEDIKNNPEVKVAVMVGALEIDYLKGVGVPDNQIVTVPDQPSAISALQSNRVQAATMTGPALQAMLDSTKDPNLERVSDFEQPVIDGKSVRGYGAAAFRKEDTAFREAFNAELEKLKESGELLEILQQFGFTEDELPGDMTAEEAAKP